MEKQQTAVEWLKELYSKRMLFAEDFEQAKQMEREQIIKAAIYDPCVPNIPLPAKSGVEYFNLNYGQ